MKYLEFIIQSYKAIATPVRVDLRKRSLFPIIGINEAGKTTVLQAIFALDHFNDALNDGRHLKDTTNLYRTNPSTPRISALVECDRDDLHEAFSEVIAQNDEAMKAEASIWQRKRNLPTQLTITRELQNGTYSIDTPPFDTSRFQDALARALFVQLPYILYFDDFRDRVDERISIPAVRPEILRGWIAIFEQLFAQTDAALSLFDLADMEERRRKSTLAKVQRRLNMTLTKEWQNFRLDDTDALEIALDYLAPDDRTKSGGQLKVDIIERDVNGDEHYFFVADRSKGFFWFFNFVMKLEFNPKVVSEGEQGSIYLLDEPGSYLHALAQSKLCQKLRALSDRTNKVLYCTHSHYLLDPDVIPLSTILVADKDGNGSIHLVPIHEHQGNVVERRSAFQPVVDALRIKPFIMDLNHSQVLLVEGIYDYYVLELLRLGRQIAVVPSVNADSIKYYISLMLAWQTDFRALWDNDDEGRQRRREATDAFGAEVADRFFLLPARGRNRIMQDMFAGEDLVMIRRELEISQKASFEKTIATLFYSQRRSQIANMIGAATKASFVELWDSLRLP